MNKVFLERKEGTKRLLFKFKFNKRIQAVIKSVDRTAIFNSESGFWEGDARILKEIVAAFKKNYIYFQLTSKMAEYLNTNLEGKTKEEVEAERKWLREHESNALDSESFNESMLEFREGFNLYGYQRAGVDYIIKKNGRALLADEMGLGKTVQAIGASKYFKFDWPVVVIAPSSLLFNWKKEFLQWLPELNDEDITVISKSKDRPKGHITIASYDYASKKSKKLQEYIGIKGFLIVDESHNVKNIEAGRTKGILSLAHAALRCVFISGTPILNTPIEIFTQAHALYPNIFPDYEDFAFTYCNAQWTKYGLDVSGASRLEELHHILRDNMMVRRLKNDVLTQLPEKRRTTLFIDVNAANNDHLYDLQAELKEAIRTQLLKNNFDFALTKKNLLSYNPEDDNSGDGDYKAMALEAYRLAGLAKLPYISDWVGDRLDNEIDKLIIFGHHKEFLDGVQEKIEEMGLEFMRIDGTTSKEQRFENTERFQNDPICQVAILSINAASVGLTLTAASNVLMGEIPFTPGIALQAEDRVHRNGQKNGCNIYYGIGNDTVDPALWNNLLKKNEISNVALDGGTGTTLDEDFELSNGVLESLIMEVSEELQSEVQVA